MTLIYKFRVKLTGLERYIWRDIEITSVSSIAKLGYAIIASFSGNGDHLFCIKINGKLYEFTNEENDYSGKKPLNPLRKRLSFLNLGIGDRLAMEYDYGAGWEFDIELVSIEEMFFSSYSHYPYITGGKGNGIIEDTSPSILNDYIIQTNTGSSLPTYYDDETEKEVEWDYRNFDLKYINKTYKHEIKRIKSVYENSNK